MLVKHHESILHDSVDADVDLNRSAIPNPMTMPQEAALLPVYGGCCFTTGKGFSKRLEGLVTKSQINDSKINLYDESFYSKTLRQVGGPFAVGWRSSGRNHQCKWL